MDGYKILYLNNSSKGNYKNFRDYPVQNQFNIMYNETIMAPFSNPRLGDYNEEAFKSPSLNYMKKLPPITKQELKYKFIN